MALYVRGLVIKDVTQVHSWYHRCLKDAEKLLAEARAKKNLPVTRIAQRLVDELVLSYNTFNANLRETAQAAAVMATVDMRNKLKEHERPAVGAPPASEHVIARPINTGGLETGAVGIGDVAFLNRIKNPHSPGYHSFWRALEYGTGNFGVPSQIGRVIMGVFGGTGGSDATAPDAQYAGGRGPHPVFMSKKNAPQSAKSRAGFGTIGKENAGKHFIEHGADMAAVKWREDMAKLQERALRSLSEIVL